jgi:hypothetical protein
MNVDEKGEGGSNRSITGAITEEDVFIDLSVCFKIFTMYSIYISSIFELEIPLPVYTTILAFIIDPLILSTGTFDCFLAEIFPNSEFLYLNLKFKIIFPFIISFGYYMIYVIVQKIRKQPI